MIVPCYKHRRAQKRFREREKMKKATLESQVCEVLKKASSGKKESYMSVMTTFNQSAMTLTGKYEWCRLLI